MSILRVVAGLVDTVELVGQGQQLEVVEEKLELPGVGDKGDEVGGRPAGPVVDHVLETLGLEL